MRTASQLYNQDKYSSFNMTPIIDIVFLLIIFFLVICQFIEAENFEINIPDGCEFAQSPDNTQPGTATITVMKADNGRINFAVGSEKIVVSKRNELVDKLAELIDVRLKDIPAENRVATLRIDKDICFADAQYALAGVAASCARNAHLATLKDKQPTQ